MLAPYCTLNGEAQKKSFWLGFERHRGAIHAITETGFDWSVGKNMTKMTVTVGTAYLDPAHTEAIVFYLGDCFWICGRGEAWPAATAVKFAL